MESTVEIESRDSFEVRSEGLGEKRLAEDGEDVELEGPVAKKGRFGGGGGVVGNMKKVAEIVMVLAAMGKMRGGRSPTVAEKEMMAEARTKLVEVCGGFAPKDVFPRDAFGTVIEDLGLNNLREQRLGFRPPKMSIAEKLLITKRKMEKSSAAYLSQRLQTNSGAATENRGTSHAVRMFPSDKPSPVSSGGFQPVSAANSTSLPYQLPTSEVRPMVSSGLTSSHLGRDSSLELPKVERPHFRLDERSNGSSYVLQAPANSSGDHTFGKTPTWSVQTQSASSAKVGSDNKVPSHTSAKVEGAADMRISPMTPQAVSSKPFTSQAPSMHQHLHGMNFVQAPSVGNGHNEIGKIVQKLLHPQLPQHPTWIPPSRDYMNKAVTCQECKQTINDVDSVLVCDACEKGFHLKCLQSSNQKAVPRGEWHCGKCLALSQGKPLPPKYGRVTRNINAPKMSSITSSVQSPVGKKMGSLAEKVSQPKISANGNSNLLSAPTGTMGNSSSHPASGLKTVLDGEMQGNDIVLSKGNIDGKPPPNHCPNNLKKASVAACVSPAGLSGERTREDKLVSESKSHSPAKSEIVTSESQAPGNAQDNDPILLANSSEIPLKQCPNDNHMLEDSEKPCGGENLNCDSDHDTKQDKQGVTQANPVEASGTSIGATDNGSSSDGLHGVDWIGDVLQVADEKTYYQSFCVNGVAYKVQDYVLFRSNNKMMPSKLQAMWEDSKTRSKWVTVHRCYFPVDLPEEVGCPPAPESNEVYESNHESTLMAAFIQGPCQVLTPSKFIEESETRALLGMEANERLRPIFLCK
ncbi:unnamed protein product [Ilex paraguariensis]|uniref:PHD finger protein n=1 Tax=Ilex paraguariensis TaxID=185542 RepID=A0ABC8T7U8_9AQUA